jgi:hypothetical protein
MDFSEYNDSGWSERFTSGSPYFSPRPPAMSATGGLPRRELREQAPRGVRLAGARRRRRQCQHSLEGAYTRPHISSSCSVSVDETTLLPGMWNSTFIFVVSSVNHQDAYSTVGIRLKG